MVEVTKLKYTYNYPSRVKLDELVIDSTRTIPEPTLLEVYNYNDSNLKKGFIGQEKRTNYCDALKEMYIQRNIDLLNSIKKTILSIQTAVTTPAGDGW